MPVRSPSLDEVMAKRKGSAVERDGHPVLFKVFNKPASFKSTDDGREAKFIMSTETEDRYGDIVVQEGMDTTEFEKNPIALWMHNHLATPLGQWSGLLKVLGGRPKRTEGVLRFSPEGEFDDVDKIARLVEMGIYKACSIGFMPKSYEWIKDDEGNHTWGLRFAESELLECSVVAVGANQEALVKAAGGDRKFVLAAIEDVLDTWAKTHEGLIVPRVEFEKVYETIDGRNAKTIDLSSVAINASPDEVSAEDEADGEGAKASGAIRIELDTSDAEERIGGLTKMVEALALKLKEVFSGVDGINPPIDTRIEPEAEQTSGAALPMAASPMDADTAKTRARSIRDRNKVA
jgi:HK97 family phage prohead protease